MKRILFSILVGLNTLLLFFLLFENRLTIPAWLQVFGRVHPLFLHFPIVFVLVVAVIALFSNASFRQNSWYADFIDFFLLAAAFTSSITAIMGLFLSLTGDYDPESIFWHKWAGIFIPFMLFILYYFRNAFFKTRIASVCSGVLITTFIVIAGHYGSVITHGENFVFAPVAPEKEQKLPAFEDALVYADLVHPILEVKCMSCHNGKKAKGQLIMETKELLIKGGKNGKLWDSTKNSLGLLMERINLPVEAKKHMPPSGKTQLTDQEIAVLHDWISRGSDFDKKVSELSRSDTLYMIGKKIFGSSPEENYDFPMPDKKQLERLSNNNRLIVPLALGSPALRVVFFNASLFKNSFIEELQPLRENIVDMSLENMPMTDDGLKFLKQFRNLRKLNLNSTGLTGQSLAALSSLPSLKSLSLSGTAIQKTHLVAVSTFPKLKYVYLGNTNVTQGDAKELEERNKGIVFLVSNSGDTIILKLTPPILDNEQDVITTGPLEVKMKHYINGAVIKYTLDGKDPDSVLSPEYKGNLFVNTNTQIKARAFRKGWISSDVAKHYYFRRTYSPDSISLVNPPIEWYKANGARSLIDREKSDLNFVSGRWVGFHKENMDCNLYFSKPVVVSNVTLSYLYDFSVNIFPPEKVQVWGGPDLHHLKLLATMNSDQPKKMEFKAILPAECNFNPTEVRLIRIIARPLHMLPDWHQDKKTKAALLIDEIFVN